MIDKQVGYIRLATFMSNEAANEMRKAVEADLMARGFRPVTRREDAHFLVTYGVQLDERLRVTLTNGLSLLRRLADEGALDVEE